MKVSWDDQQPNINGNIKLMFQTTNQKYSDSSSIYLITQICVRSLGIFLQLLACHQHTGALDHVVDSLLVMRIIVLVLHIEKQTVHHQQGAAEFRIPECCFSHSLSLSM